MLPNAKDMPPGAYRLVRGLRLSSKGLWSEAWFLVNMQTGLVEGPVLSTKEKLWEWMKGAGEEHQGS